MHYTYDPLNRITEIVSRQFSEKLHYDPVGNITQTICQGIKTGYSYDSLYQLTQEMGESTQSYTFDSLNNRRSKNNKEYDYRAICLCTFTGLKISVNI